MRYLRRFLILAVIFVLSSGIVGGASAYLDGIQDFPESGYSISGEYEAYYNSLADPLLTIGLPISVEIVTDPNSGESYQYFTRALLEKRLVNGKFEIRRVQLGSILHEGGREKELPANAPCRTFENGRKVCYAFMQFYEANNGGENFGKPISDMEDENGRTVQYFEYARLEWRPEIASDSHVFISDLGKIHIDMMGINPNQSHYNIPGLEPDRYIGPLTVLVFVDHSVVMPGEAQTVFVIVQNAALEGIEGANITISLIFPDGSQQKLPPATSNADGISQATFMVPPNLTAEDIIRIEVNSSSNGNTGSGKSWFRVRP